MNQTHDTSPGALFDGRYRIIGRLGQGGMARVFLAEDESLHRKVAVKVLADRYSDDPHFIERFQREALCRAAKSLEHRAGLRPCADRRRVVHRAGVRRW